MPRKITNTKSINKKSKAKKVPLKKKTTTPPKKRYLKRHEIYDTNYHDVLKSSVVSTVLNLCKDLTGQQRTVLKELATELQNNQHLTVSKARRAIRNASKPKKPRKQTPWMRFVAEKRQETSNVTSQSTFIKEIAKEWKLLNTRQKSKYGVQTA